MPSEMSIALGAKGNGPEIASEPGKLWGWLSHLVGPGSALVAAKLKDNTRRIEKSVRKR